MSSRVSQELLDFLGAYDTYLIVGHKEPDGDCVGSQLVIQSFLKRSGKDAIAISSGPFTRTEVMPFEHRFFETAPRKIRNGALIVLDCSSLSRIGRVAETIPSLPTAFIDHHASGETAGDVVFCDPSAPSVTSMVLEILQASGDVPTREEAELLLFGLCTDTGFFRHLGESRGDVFRAAAALADAGASPKHVFSLVYGGKSLFTRKLMGELLFRVEPYFGGQLLVTCMTEEDQRRYGIASRDSDMLYQLLMTVAGVEVVLIIRQETPDNCTVGLRSRDHVDVAAIAALFGGGGHKLAAGLSMEGRIDDVRDRFIEVFEPIFVTESNLDSMM
ncbi:MAG: bifunctional oligoribonuclease/PAP phosphatase NrnA [Spirochaetes bacterium]|nr:bifunctional oligoribonuclease/PAP phosphatase NrnA [Spirochaetota bacterium]